jgi:predicted DNA-binding protein
MIDSVHDGAKKDSVRISATLSIEQHDALVELAVRKKVSVAWLIREAVDKLVEDMGGGRRLPFDS